MFALGQLRNQCQSRQKGNKPLRPSSKLYLYSIEQENRNELDLEMVMKAVNDSYTKRMSETQENYSVMDILFGIQQLGIGVPNQTLNQINWCIVQLDEAYLPENNFLSDMLCNSGCQTTQNSPFSLKFYQLLITLGGREIRLQSLNDPNRYYCVNFDTVEAYVHMLPEDNPSLSELIAVKVKDSLQLNIYINSNTLPWNFRSNPANSAKLKAVANDIHRKVLSIITNGVQNSRGRQCGLSTLLKREAQFYKNRYITEEQFSGCCETGDILLLKDNHTMAKIQRAITNSQYDHVALVYRHPKFGICLFQSSSGMGVALTVWSQLLRHKWYQNIEAIAWRRLQMTHKPPNFAAKVDSFVKDNLYKKFGWSLRKLFRFKSKGHEQKAQTYFCSELIATLYQKLGLIDPQISPTQYWPRTFSDKGNLHMLQDSALAPERQLIFDKEILRNKYPFMK